MSDQTEPIHTAPDRGQLRAIASAFADDPESVVHVFGDPSAESYAVFKHEDCDGPGWAKVIFHREAQKVTDASEYKCLKCGKRTEESAAS